MSLENIYLIEHVKGQQRKKFRIVIKVGMLGLKEVTQALDDMWICNTAEAVSSCIAQAPR